MSTVLRGEAPLAEEGSSVRRRPAGWTGIDRVFALGARGVGAVMLVVIGGIGFFLALQSIPTFGHYGLGFLTETQWQPEADIVGIGAVLIGTVSVAAVAIFFAFPLALLTALFINEYAAPRLRGMLTSLVDLMAAVPSIIYGIWGFFLIQPHASEIALWLHRHLGFIPIFDVGADPWAAWWDQTRYTGSAFVAGIAVAMMTLPMACAVMREVFSQTPVGEREAALALGATRWGVVRNVVLPFGKGGIIGGTMLGLGRALGETIAVLLIISPAFEVKPRILEVGTNTVAALIAGRFGEASASQLSALLTAGFVLFVITLFVNSLAAMVVARSRSGLATEA